MLGSNTLWGTGDRQRLPSTVRASRALKKGGRINPEDFDGGRKTKGKKRMRQFGKVEIPQSAFLAALKMDA